MENKTSPTRERSQELYSPPLNPGPQFPAIPFFLSLPPRLPYSFFLHSVEVHVYFRPTILTTLIHVSWKVVYGRLSFPWPWENGCEMVDRWRLLPFVFDEQLSDLFEVVISFSSRMGFLHGNAERTWRRGNEHFFPSKLSIWTMSPFRQKRNAENRAWLMEKCPKPRIQALTAIPAAPIARKHFLARPWERKESQLSNKFIPSEQRESSKWAERFSS